MYPQYGHLFYIYIVTKIDLIDRLFFQENRWTFALIGTEYRVRVSAKINCNKKKNQHLWKQTASVMIVDYSSANFCNFSKYVINKP